MQRRPFQHLLLLLVEDQLERIINHIINLMPPSLEINKISKIFEVVLVSNVINIIVKLQFKFDHIRAKEVNRVEISKLAALRACSRPAASRRTKQRPTAWRAERMREVGWLELTAEERESGTTSAAAKRAWRAGQAPRRAQRGPAEGD